jgi:hypothetical protein
VGHTGPMGVAHEPGSNEPHITDDDELAAFDLDDDGKISILEEERARLGVVDARLDEISHEGGVKGKIADVAHKIVDKLDND